MIAGAAKGQRAQHGLRPLNPETDLAQVADLIEASFTDEIGDLGRTAVRELRLMSRFGPLLWLMDRTSVEFRDAMSGYVWLEEGRIVGNVTLSRPRLTSTRWHIANVAVAKEYRGRGIGRQLVAASLDLASDRLGEWAILHVRDDNLPALNIYRQLGFQDLFTTVELVLQGRPNFQPPLPTGNYLIRQSRPQDWEAEYELAVAATAATERWLRGIEPTKFRRDLGQQITEWLRDLFSGSLIHRYCLEYEGRIVAKSTLHVRSLRGESRLSVQVHPDYHGKVERILIGQVLVPHMEKGGERLLCEHTASHQEGILALLNVGFSEMRRLLTMRKAL